MKLLYLTTQNSHSKNSHGVFKKINNQIQCIKEFGIDVELIDLLLEKKWKRTLPLTTASLNWDIVNIDKTVDVIYIRYILSDNIFLDMLKRLKKQKPNIKIIVEIPTYPYEKEQTIKQAPIILKDRFYRKQLYKYVDRIVCFNEKYKNIFGIPVIGTVNGIIVDNIFPKKICEHTDTIHVLAVALLAKWHGYDRFIRGIGEYYKNCGARDIHFHVVGDGGVLPLYKDISQKYDIKNRITFYGAKIGQELDKIYDQCEIGIDVLGLHRKNLNCVSTIKSREYWAKGLPFITACNFLENVNDIKAYIHQVPQDESPVDIEKVIEFYDNIYLKSGKSKQKIIDEIRGFAYKACDMKVTMKPVIDYINA